MLWRSAASDKLRALGKLTLGKQAISAATLDPDSLTAPLALILTFDEEVGLLGAKHFAETWPESSPLS